MIDERKLLNGSEVHSLGLDRVRGVLFLEDHNSSIDSLDLPHHCSSQEPFDNLGHQELLHPQGNLQFNDAVVVPELHLIEIGGFFKFLNLVALIILFLLSLSLLFHLLVLLF